MLLSKGVLSILNHIEMLHWSPGWKMNFWTSDLLITKKKKRKKGSVPTRRILQFWDSLMRKRNIRAMSKTR